MTPQWNDAVPDPAPEPGPDYPPPDSQRNAVSPEPGPSHPPPQPVAGTSAPEHFDPEATEYPDLSESSPEYPEPHEWLVADAERGIEVRQLSPNHYQLRRPDGSVDDMTAAEFDTWRQEGAGLDDQS